MISKKAPYISVETSERFEAFIDKDYKFFLKAYLSIKHYIKENILAQSLCELNYQNNLNFLNMRKQLGLTFKAHDQFKKKDIEERQELYKAICEQIWAY